MAQISVLSVLSFIVGVVAAQDDKGDASGGWLLAFAIIILVGALVLMTIVGVALVVIYIKHRETHQHVQIVHASTRKSANLNGHLLKDEASQRQVDIEAAVEPEVAEIFEAAKEETATATPAEEMAPELPEPSTRKERVEAAVAALDAAPAKEEAADAPVEEATAAPVEEAPAAPVEETADAPAE